MIGLSKFQKLRENTILFQLNRYSVKSESNFDVRTSYNFEIFMLDIYADLG